MCSARLDFVYDLFKHVQSRNKQETLKSSSKHRRPTVISQFKVRVRVSQRRLGWSGAVATTDRQEPAVFASDAGLFTLPDGNSEHRRPVFHQVHQAERSQGQCGDTHTHTHRKEECLAPLVTFDPALPRNRQACAECLEDVNE